MSAWLLQPDQSAPIHRAGGVEFDRDARKIRRAGKEVQLGPVEFRIIELLASDPDRVFSRADILQGVWGAGDSVDIRTIDAHIRHLRRALGRDAIRTARGRGYAFNEKASRV